MCSTSEDKIPVSLNNHTQAVFQPSAFSSPASLQNPVLQQEIMSSEEQLSDDEYSGILHRSTESDCMNFKTDAAASLSYVCGNCEDYEALQSHERTDGTKPRCSNLLQHNESFTVKSELSVNCESPFMPICCTSDHTAVQASEIIHLTSSGLNCTSQDVEHNASKRSPPLEHKGGAQVEALNSPQQSNIDESCTDSTPTQPRSQPTPYQENMGEMTGDASETADVSTIKTVTLWRREDESFGLDVEIMSSPLKVVITGLKPGGAAERVRPDPFSVNGWLDLTCLCELFKK